MSKNSLLPLVQYLYHGLEAVYGPMAKRKFHLRKYNKLIGDAVSQKSLRDRKLKRALRGCFA